MDQVEVEVWRLVQDEHGKDVVVLRDQRNRHLPIWIGPCEAAAIWLKLVGKQANAVVRRPMTHDLCVTLIERLGARLERIVIDDCSNDTYYAKVHLCVNGRAITIDSRPSDAIAFALRCGASVWVNDAVMEASEITIEEDESAGPNAFDDYPDIGTADEGT